MLILIRILIKMYVVNKISRALLCAVLTTHPSPLAEVTDQVMCLYGGLATPAFALIRDCWIYSQQESLIGFTVNQRRAKPLKPSSSGVHPPASNHISHLDSRWYAKVLVGQLAPVQHSLELGSLAPLAAFTFWP